ncbi:MAG: EAL domain-containing protein [Tardiphaga sp.]
MHIADTPPHEALASVLAALQQAIHGVIIIDSDNNITHFNMAAERMWDCTRAEVLGRNARMLIPVDLQAGDGGLTVSNRESGTNRIVGGSRELQIVRKDGTKIWAAFSLSRVDVAGNISYMAFVRDVTEEVALREQHKLMSLVADKTDRAVIIADRDERIVYVNNAFVEEFGYSLDDTIGKIASQLLVGEYTDRETLDRLKAQIVHDGNAQEDLLAYDQAGNEIWMSTTVNVMRDRDGEIENIIILLADITQSKQIQSLQYHILEALADDMPVLEVIDQLCRRVETIAPDIVSSVFHVDADRRLRPLGAPSLPDRFLASLDGVVFAPDVGASAFRGSPVLAKDIATDPHWRLFKEIPLAAGLRASWSTPIKAKDGRVIGAFAFYFREMRGPTRWHQTIVDACVHLCALAIERHEARIEIDQLVYFDALTGLPNRVRLRQIMQPLIENRGVDECFAVMFIDLDHFKDVNDTLGHLVGDDMLIRVTQRLRAQLRPGDTMSRQGGDEFVIVLPNCDAAGAKVIANRILNSLQFPIQLGSQMVPVAASIGISLYPDNAIDIDSMLKHADAAMYKVKQAGRSAYCFFSSDMNRVVEERLALSISLRNAIANGELRLHYQPQIRTIDGCIYGVEALARWHDPVLGDVPPSRFIPVAEECGLIEMIGVWSLREACRQIAVWREAELDVPCVSVNLSPINFQNGDLATLVADIIADHDLPPEMLMLEVTESVVMSEHSNALRMMEKIRETGVGLSMDDFGTGYSSLNRLASLPVRELKIDRSFMHDIESEASALAITTAVVRVGQSLDMKVVAEGVETEGQRRILTELGCDVIQGYLYSPALSAPDLELWLSKRRASQAAAALVQIGGAAPDERRRPAIADDKRLH